MHPKYNLNDFDITTVPVNARVAIIARAGCGKSTLMKDLLYQHRDKYTAGIIIDGAHATTCYGMLPNKFIFEEYKPEVITKLQNRHLKLIRRNGINHNNIPACLVLDNVYINKDNEKSFDMLFKQSRLLHISMMISMEYPERTMKPQYRCSLDYVFIGRTDSKHKKRQLYEQYAGMFPNFNAFSETLDQLRPYEYMVINNRCCIGSNVENMVKLYEPVFRDSFEIGPERLWEYNKC